MNIIEFLEMQYIPCGWKREMGITPIVICVP
jgi:hypothetical protein